MAAQPIYYTNGVNAWKLLGEGECMAITLVYGGVIAPRVRICNPISFGFGTGKFPTKEITQKEFLKHFDKAMNYFIGVATKK